MCEYFLSYLFCENFEESVKEILSYAKWSKEDKSQYNYPKSLNINIEDLRNLENLKSANEILSKLYFEDNELLFLIVYTQRIIYLSALPEVFKYNSDFEDPDFKYNPDIHEHIDLTDVDVFMLRTKNKIFVFGKSSDPYYTQEEFVIKSDQDLSQNRNAIKLFNRLGIKNKRNFETLTKKIDKLYKTKIKK